MIAGPRTLQVKRNGSARLHGGKASESATAAAILPDGVELRAAGTGTEENRKMLAAFRWNLQLLSYIALVVGAFLIYNTISVSVVRRRAEIGIVRALGASRATVLAAFLGEAASLGLIGALIGLPLGRLMASGAVKLMSATVEALYVSSRPGAIALSAESVCAGADGGNRSCGGFGICAGARGFAGCAGRSDGARAARIHCCAFTSCAMLADRCRPGTGRVAASRAPAVAGKPLFGYLATLLVIAASALAIPALVDLTTRVLTRAARGDSGRRSFACVAEFVGVAAAHFGFGRRAVHGDRHDDRGRHHGRQFSRRRFCSGWTISCQLICTCVPARRSRQRTGIRPCRRNSPTRLRSCRESQPWIACANTKSATKACPLGSRRRNSMRMRVYHKADFLSGRATQRCAGGDCAAQMPSSSASHLRTSIT